MLLHAKVWCRISELHSSFLIAQQLYMGAKYFDILCWYFLIKSLVWGNDLPSASTLLTLLRFICIVKPICCLENLTLLLISTTRYVD